MSPERLIQGRRAKVIATLVAGAEFLGAPGAVAQNPTPQAEAQPAAVTRTQILPESPYAWVYTAPWLYLSTPSCKMEGPKPEPTPNTIPAADANVSAHAQEAPKPSFLLAKQTMSDGSTVICTLPDSQAIEQPKPVEHDIRKFMNSEEPRKGSLAKGAKLAGEVYKDQQAVDSYLEAVGVDPNKDLKNCKDKKIKIIDRSGYCMSATVGLFYLSKDATLSPDTREKAWNAGSQLYNWEVTSPIFPKGMKDFVDSFLVAVI